MAERLQILVDLENLKEVLPESNLTVKSQVEGKDTEVWIRYNHLTKQMKVLEVTSANPHLTCRSSEWTGDVKEIEQWVVMEGLKVARVKSTKRKTVWAYINGKKKWDVVQLALSMKIMLPEMKARIQKQYPDVEFKVGV